VADVISDADGDYWFLFDDVEQQLTVYCGQDVAGVANNCGLDDVRDVFDDIVAHDRKKRLQ
jgi:hypothetical protein